MINLPQTGKEIPARFGKAQEDAGGEGGVMRDKK